MQHRDLRIVAVPELAEMYPGSFKFQTIDDNEKKRINEQLFAAILNFGDRIIDGKMISQHLNFDGAGLWYYHKFRIFFNIVNEHYQLVELNNNLNGASSALIYTSGPENLRSKLDLDDVEIITSPKRSGEQFSIWSAFQYGVTVVIRFILSLFASKSAFNRKKFLSIDSVAQYRNVLSLDGSSIIFENVFTGYLYQKKRNEIGFIDQLLIPKFKGRDRYRFDAKHIINHNKRARILGEYVISRALLSARILRKVLKSRSDLQQKYTLIKQHIKDDPGQLQILNEFIKLHTTTSFYLLKFYAYLRFFKGKVCRSIMTVDENSANYKIILDAAKQHGIYTIGYQHGNISRFSPNYMYSKADISQKPMPDLTITWGSKWVELLQNSGNYRRDSLEIAGQIRTDVIKPLEQNNSLDRRTIVNEIKENHIVLFATQPQKDESLRYRAAEDAVIACENLDSVHLVFKLHPRELDPEFYISIAEKQQFDKYSILRDKELYLLLKVSDVVITCFSTVGTEALYFHKPLIVLDHLKEDILGYCKDGVAFQATNAAELQKHLTSTLNKKISTDQKIVDEYLQRSTYKIDGMAADRVWQFVQSGSDRQSS